MSRNGCRLVCRRPMARYRAASSRFCSLGPPVDRDRPGGPGTADRLRRGAVQPPAGGARARGDSGRAPRTRPNWRPGPGICAAAPTGCRWPRPVPRPNPRTGGRFVTWGEGCPASDPGGGHHDHRDAVEQHPTHRGRRRPRHQTQGRPGSGLRGRRLLGAAPFRATGPSSAACTTPGCSASNASLDSRVWDTRLLPVNCGIFERISQR